VKALKELEELDLTHLERLLGMISSLKQSETTQSESGVSKTVGKPVETPQSQSSAI
jgi:hypothetical protein